MARKETREPAAENAAPAPAEPPNETPFETLSGLRSVLVIGLFVLSFSVRTS